MENISEIDDILNQIDSVITQIEQLAYQIDSSIVKGGWEIIKNISISAEENAYKKESQIWFQSEEKSVSNAQKQALKTTAIVAIPLIAIGVFISGYNNSIMQNKFEEELFKINKTILPTLST